MDDAFNLVGRARSRLGSFGRNGGPFDRAFTSRRHAHLEPFIYSRRQSWSPHPSIPSEHVLEGAELICCAIRSMRPNSHQRLGLEVAGQAKLLCTYVNPGLFFIVVGLEPPPVDTAGSVRRSRAR